MPRLRDHEWLADAHDALRLAQDRLDPTRVLVVAGDLARVRGRLELVQPDDLPLRLRDDLLSDDQDVAVLELDLRDDELGEVIALTDLRQAGDRYDSYFGAQGRPVRRMPACAL